MEKSKDILMIKTEQEVEAMLRRDLIIYFSIFQIEDEKQIEYLQMVSRIIQRIYLDYLSNEYLDSIKNQNEEE